MEVQSHIRNVAPIVRRAFQSMGIGQKAHAHGAGDSARVVGDQAHHVQRILLDVLGEVRDGVQELADMDGQVQGRAELDQALLIGRADRVFEPRIVQLIQEASNRHGLEAVIALHGIVHQDIFVANRLAYLSKLLHVPDVAGDGRPLGVLAAAGMNLVSPVPEAYGLQHIGDIVFHRGKML